MVMFVDLRLELELLASKPRSEFSFNFDNIAYYISLE